MHDTLNTEADGLPSFLSVISVTIGNSTMSSLYETIYFRNERNFTGSSKERKFKKKRFINLLTEFHSKQKSVDILTNNFFIQDNSDHKK